MRQKLIEFFLFIGLTPLIAATALTLAVVAYARSGPAPVQPKAPGVLLIPAMEFTAVCEDHQVSNGAITARTLPDGKVITVQGGWVFMGAEGGK